MSQILQATPNDKTCQNFYFIYLSNCKIKPRYNKKNFIYAETILNRQPNILEGVLYIPYAKLPLFN